jgi:hypothetical protein
MGRPPARFISGLVIAGGVLLVAALILVLTRPAPAPPPLPNPNGYDDFLKAGGMLTVDLSDYRDLDKEKLRAELQMNVDALKMAWTGLSRECRVPIDPSPTMTNHLMDLPKVKRLAYLFAAEGRLAELENRPADAAKAYSEGIALGVNTARGGVIIDVLVGIAVESICAAQLEKLVPSLDAKTCRDTAAALERIEARRDTPAVMLKQEKEWVRRCYGIKGQLAVIVTYKSIAATRRGAGSKLNNQTLRARSLIVALACQAFRVEKGHSPADLAELVPAYLSAVPLDPLTGTNLAMRP